MLSAHLDRRVSKKGERMNDKNHRLAARFGPETRFEVRPAPVAPFWVEREDALEGLKRRLLGQRLSVALGADLTSALRRAANEAAALAWAAGYPLLLFPVLFEEQAEAAAQRTRRQVEIKRRSRDLLLA